MILTPDQVVMALLQAQRELGVQLTREELVGLTEIPSRESGYDTQAHNPNRATGDDSYGLWQVNMLGSMGVNRARALGISDYSQMFDPVTSAKAAIQLVLAGRKQGDPLHAWGGYKGMSNTYNVSAAASRAAAAAVDRIGAGVQGGGERFLSTMRQGIYSGANKGASPAAQQLVQFLQAQIGKPYRFGSTGPDAFDCSGLGAAAYAQLGIQVAPLTFTMAKYNQVTDVNNLQPGDMLLVHGSQGDFGHVGYYVGGGQVIDAPHTGATVRTTPLSDWLPRIQKVTRVMDGNGRVIIGSGLTPKITSPTVGTVPLSQAALMPDAMTPNTGSATTDPYALMGAGTTNTTQKILADRQPFVLPGLGGKLEPA